MLTCSANEKVVIYEICYFICAAFDRLEETASSYANVDAFQRNIVFFESIFDDVLSETLLISNLFVLCQLFCAVSESLVEYLVCVFEYCNLG